MLIRLLIKILMLTSIVSAHGAEFNATEILKQLSQVNSTRREKSEEAAREFNSANQIVNELTHIDTKIAELSKKIDDLNEKIKRLNNEVNAINTRSENIRERFKVIWPRLVEIKGEYEKDVNEMYRLADLIKWSVSEINRNPKNHKLKREYSKNIEQYQHKHSLLLMKWDGPAKEELERLKHEVDTGGEEINRGSITSQDLIFQGRQVGESGRAIIEEQNTLVQKLTSRTNDFTSSFMRGVQILYDIKGITDVMRNHAKNFLTNTLDGIGEFFCFEKGTIIETDQGPKAIETLKARKQVDQSEQVDRVIACSENGECRPQEILEIMSSLTDTLVVLTVQDEELVTTPNHPIYTVKAGWTHAEEIEEGDEVQVLIADENKKFSLQTQIVQKKEFRPLDTPIEVFNLSVQEDSTYFAGKMRLLVHNCKLDKSDEILFPVVGAALGVCTVSAQQCGVSMNLGPIALVGGPPVAVMNFAHLAASCGTALTVCGALVASSNELGQHIAIMQQQRSFAGASNSTLGLRYENPGQHDPSRLGRNPYDPRKSVLPKNHEELWEQSKLCKDGNRWTKVGSGKKAEYHRFQHDNNGNWHWNGSTNGVTARGEPYRIELNWVPNEIKG